MASVWLIANVREADAARVHVGQVVKVRVLAYPDRIFDARLSYVAAFIDPVTHRIAVRAVMKNADRALKPQMSATCQIVTSELINSPAVPATAVVYEGERAHVWVLSADGNLVFRPIHTGRSNDALIEVLDGLKAGEIIATRGALFIDQVAAPASS